MRGFSSLGWRRACAAQTATGRPFTGDYAGDLLYQTSPIFGFARGIYAARADDGFELVDARIVNFRPLRAARKQTNA